MAFNYTFKRVEVKYIMDERQYAALLEGIAPFMKADDYGLSTICNIYYDTQSYDLIRRSLDKPKYKEKLRLRSYGIPSPDSTVFVELKKKYSGIVYKRRISLPFESAEAYLDRGERPDADGQILREIDYFMKLYRPFPRCFIAYDRVAYYGLEDPSLRITFDRNVRFRYDELSLSAGDHGLTVLPDGKILMEIKIPGAMPLPLASLLTELKLYPASFSKYGRAYVIGFTGGTAVDIPGRSLAISPRVLPQIITSDAGRLPSHGIAIQAAERKSM